MVRQEAANIDRAPAVSIIVPAYNTSQFIGETLQSVFAQTFTDYEVIVINDGSPDTNELERVMEPYRDRVIYIKQENRGLSGARNTGIRAARGRYIALLDSDDLWEPDYLAVQVGILERDPAIDVLYPNALFFGASPHAGRKFQDINTSNGEVTFERLITLQCQVWVGVTARREAIIRAGMFDESLRSSEDFDLWLRVVKQGGRIAYHRQVLARYRQRPGSLSSDAVWMCHHILRVLEKAGRCLDLTPDERDLLERQQAHFRAIKRLHEGKRAFERRDAKGAIEALTEANAFLHKPKLKLALLALRFAPGLLLGVYKLRAWLLSGAKGADGTGAQRAALARNADAGADGGKMEVTT
ncbi:MAG TPA: glycosyltransferase family A protein [Blastocatellia bacterium]|nr:glycosyltransferase family A protein [Blastocatellia bacterium]